MFIYDPYSMNWGKLIMLDYMSANPQTAYLGFTRVDVDAKPDDRFFVVIGPSLQGTWTVTTRQILLDKTPRKAKSKMLTLQIGTFYVNRRCLLQINDSRYQKLTGHLSAVVSDTVVKLMLVKYL